MAASAYACFASCDSPPIPASTLFARHRCSDRGACGFVLVGQPYKTPISARRCPQEGRKAHWRRVANGDSGTIRSFGDSPTETALSRRALMHQLAVRMGCLGQQRWPLHSLSAVHGACIGSLKIRTHLPGLSGSGRACPKGANHRASSSKNTSHG
jgi:hypothetical protein